MLVVFLIALWHPGNWHSTHKWWETGLALAGFGAAALASLVGAATGDRRYWRWAGVLAASVGAAACIWVTWTDANLDEAFFVLVCSVAVAAAHANLAMLAPLQGVQRWLRVVTICAVVITALALVLDVWLSHNLGGRISTLGRVALAAGILGSCGTLALIILASLNRLADHPRPATAQLADITVFCPKCGRKQTLSLGEAACNRCRLRIYVRVAEPESANPLATPPAD